MPDIAMCRSIHCGNRYTCFRYMAEPSYRQSYFTGPPKLDNKKQCSKRWPIEKGQHVRTQAEVVKVENIRERFNAK